MKSSIVRDILILVLGFIFFQSTLLFVVWWPQKYLNLLGVNEGHWHVEKLGKKQSTLSKFKLIISLNLTFCFLTKKLQSLLNNISCGNYMEQGSEVYNANFSQEGFLSIL